MEAVTVFGRGVRSLASAYATTQSLVHRGVHRVYRFSGRRIQPIRDEVARSGIRVVDVRRESVAMVTAGLGPTNALSVQVPK